MHLQSGSRVRETDLSLIWQLLGEGKLFLRETHCEAGRCFATLEARPTGKPIRPHQLAVLERVFEGEGQKTLASERGVSVATIACYCTQAMTAMMPTQWVSRAPIIAVMAALSARGAPAGRARYERQIDDQRYLISVEIPGQSFRDRLSCSEWEVAQLSIEGESHTGVAKARGTSVRTVANQLASVFGKLRVSGRSELRALAVREYAARLRTVVPPPPPPAAILSPLLPGAWAEPLRIASSA